MEFSGSLRAPQLQLRPLETPGGLGNLGPFQPEPFRDFVKYLQPRGGKWHVRWLQQPWLQGATAPFSVAKPLWKDESTYIAAVRMVYAMVCCYVIFVSVDLGFLGCF